MARMKVDFFMMVICGALLAGGCAKHETVKAEEPVAPSVSVSQQAQAQAQAKADKDRAEKDRMKSTPLESVVLPKDGSVKPEIGANAGQTGELRAGLDKIYFNFDSAALSEEARNALVNNADRIKKIAKASIRVEGNCDERGSDDYNLALGEKRAKEAVQYLINLGLPAARFTVVSYGKEKPAATGHDEASWAQNRRDEFIVVP